MPPPGWLHVNGISLSTDLPPPSDNRTKQMTSPIPPVFSPSNPLPFTTTTTANQDRQQQKLENADLPKKLFIDRQIQKAKSLPGLIKGTALSHHASIHSELPRKPPANDDMRSTTAPENDDDSSPSEQIRRPRVSFSEFNKVQFFEDGEEHSQQSTHRRHHRHRSAKKTTAIILNTQVSPPSIQHSQSLYAPYRPLSRQQPIAHELNIRKQRLIPSPRIHTSRITHLPDILNQTMTSELTAPEKVLLQREKTFFQFPEPNPELPVNSSAEISRESTRAGGVRPTAMIADLAESNDFAANSFLNTSSTASLSANRQRSHLRSISLRHQFTSPLRSKLTALPNQTQPVINPRRSASVKNTIARNHSLDDAQEDLANQNLETRPLTGINPSKQLKRNYMIHFHSKNPFNGNSTNESVEATRHSTMKTKFHDLSPERFQNVLKIVRPPYITNLHSSNQDPSLQPRTTNHINGSIRSSRTTSGHTAHDYHITTNTIFV